MARFNIPKFPEFQHTPNEADPELLVLRRRALEGNQRDRMRTRDELNRAGLLGSSASFGVLGEAEARGSRTLEDVDSQTFARRRGEALDLYRDDLDFRRKMAILEAEADMQDQNALWDSLSGLAQFGGSLLTGGMTGGAGVLRSKYLDPSSYGYSGRGY